MRRAPFTQRLALAAARRPVLTVGLWLVVVAAAALLYWGFSSSFRAADDFLTMPESKRAAQLIDEHLPAARHSVEIVIVRAASLTAEDASLRESIDELRRNLLALGRDEVLAVMTPYSAPEEIKPLLVSKDRHTLLLPVTLAGPRLEAHQTVRGVLDVAQEADRLFKEVEIIVTGSATWDFEAGELAASDLRRAEVIGIPAALVILLVVFGAAVAAAVPLILAGVAIAAAAATAAVLGTGLPLTVFALNMIISMGLAVGVDYSLFTVSRFREERRASLDVPTAIARAGATANRAVFFSGMTVVLSLLGMLLVPYSAFTSLGAGAVSVVLFSVLAALTLLPALFGLLGPRIDAWRVPGLRHHGVVIGGDVADAGRASWWARAARVIMRRPALSFCLGAALLLSVAAPTFLMERGVTGVTGLPERLSTVRGFRILSSEFSAGWTAPVQVVVEGPLLNPFVIGALGRLRADLARDGRFQPASLQTGADGRLVVLGLLQNEPPTGERALANVRDLRTRIIPTAFDATPARVYVGGITAGFLDGLRMIDIYQPIVIAVVLGLSFLLLLVAFRSVLVALTCIFMNLLSVGASYGALVLVFQYGLGADLLGFTHVERIEAWVPLLMYCVLFGLSMDYQVFLLSRIRERYDQMGDTREAVGFGIQSTAGLITGAALIMVVVFAGLASGELVMFQQIGFGLAVAVSLDATVVRTVVAPATIVLIGDRYWWLPRWLAWLPRVTVADHQTGGNMRGGSIVETTHEATTAQRVD